VGDTAHQEVGPAVVFLVTMHLAVGTLSVTPGGIALVRLAGQVSAEAEPARG
jgi:hypothetical protein